jgi:hypothetical protein
MTIPVLDTMSAAQPYNPHASRRNESQENLVLSELNPRMVIDHLDDESHPLDVLTFGSVREVCPKCRTGQLKLVLRQSAIRIAHLFCADCTSCFDAHYPNGKPALTI